MAQASRATVGAVVALALILLVPGCQTRPCLATGPHPDATPNQHRPGEVDRPELVPFIVPDRCALPGIVVDETEAILEGEWQYSTHTPPYVGLGYLHDQKTGKGKKSATYYPRIPSAGVYELRLSHCYNQRRATNTVVEIQHANGLDIRIINQQSVPEHNRLFRTLGTFSFSKGTSGWVRIHNRGTEGKYVIADAIQLLPIDTQ